MDPEVIEDEIVEAPSLRDVLEESIQEHDPQHELIPAAEEQTSESVAAPPAEGAVPPEAQPKPADPAAPAAEPPAGAAPQVPASTQELKAPAQWKPAVREKWNSLPREVQEEIHRREGDSMRLIGSVGPKIRLADEVSQHLAPFAERLAGNGASQSVFIHDVFSSIKSLASGNPQEQAEVVANIVQSYGIDVRMLDQILTHRLNQPPEVMEARRATQIAQGIIRQHTQTADQQSAQQAQVALAAFAADPKNEFFGDVRTFMADLIDSGQAKTLEDAYAAAVWANADTRKILLQREAQTRASGKNKRATTARRASSAIHGSPSIPGPATPSTAGMSLRESIEAAVDEHSSL